MRAGAQRAALPLMRRFNEHSERLLDSALSVPPLSSLDSTDGPRLTAGESRPAGR